MTALGLKRITKKGLFCRNPCLLLIKSGLFCYSCLLKEMKPEGSTATACSGCRISHLLPITPPWDTMLPRFNGLDTQIQTPHPHQLFYIQSLNSNMKKNDTKRSSPTKQITAGKQVFYLTFLDVNIWGGRKEQLIIVCI